MTNSRGPDSLAALAAESGARAAAAEITPHAAAPGTPGRRALPVAGDPGAGKDLVCDLVDALGFDPVDAGPLADSWRQQPGAPVYGSRLDAAGVREALAAAAR